MTDQGSLRNQLRAVRTRVGLSQSELAAAAGVTRQTVSGIEAGLYGPSAAVALRLARALGCRVEELFWLEEERQPLEAVPAEGFPARQAARVSLAPVGGRWVAHPLLGDEAFRAEMVPADGVGCREECANTLAVRPLEDPRAFARTAVVAGCTPALSLWARAAERWYPGLRVHWTFANSARALAALARGEVHAAGVHLRDPATGECNTPFVRRAFEGEAIALINLGEWEEGLAVWPGNPLSIRRGADLARPDVSLVNREPGAGSRQLLEEALAADGVDPAQVAGFEREVPGHQEVAREVALRRAATGVTTAAVAAAYGLDFVPLRSIRYDLAVRKEYLEQEPVRQLLAALDHRWLRAQLSALVGYDTSRTGEVVAEIAA